MKNIVILSEIANGQKKKFNMMNLPDIDKIIIFHPSKNERHLMFIHTFNCEIGPNG